MCDPVGMIKDVGLNLVTGGLYSVGKAVVKTVETGNPMNLLSQGLDLGLASTGNAIAKDVGGNGAAMAFNLAGLTAGAVGAGGVGSLFASTPTEGLMTPLATAAPEAAATESGMGETMAANAPKWTGEVGAIPQPDLAPATSGAATPSSPELSSMTDPFAVNARVVSVGTPPPSGSPNLSGLIDDLGGTTAKTGAKAGTDAASSESGIASVLPWLVAGQTGAGLLQGAFTGLSAQKQLELQRMTLDQEQRQRNFNNANSNYAPQPIFVR